MIKNKETEQTTMSYLLRVVIIFVILGKTILPVYAKANTIYNRNLTLTKPYKGMVAYIRNNTEKNAVFSGWNWSLPFYVDLDDDGDHIIKDRAAYPPQQRESVPEYFIVSPEWPLVKVTEEPPYAIGEGSSYTIEQNEIRKEFLKQNATLVKTFGDKDHKWLLYKVNNDGLVQSP